MLPDFSKLKKVLVKQQGRLFAFAKKQNLNPYFQQIPQVAKYEGESFLFQYTDDLKYESNYKTIQENFEIPYSDLKRNPALIYEHIYDVGKTFANRQMQMTFQTIDDVTELTGNVLRSDANIPDQMLEMLEKISIPFDSNGHPELPSIHVGIEMQEKIQTAFESMKDNGDYTSKLEAIINKKKKEWYDRENNRELVG